MESVETNNQVEYTQEEKGLAARYKVEPKLVRLLDELIEDKLAPPEQAEEQEQAEQEEENRPNTGIPLLDNYYENLSLEAKVAVCGTMDLMCRANETGDKIREYLRNEVGIFYDPEEALNQTVMDNQIWAECAWFLGFVIGTEVGLREA